MVVPYFNSVVLAQSFVSRLITLVAAWQEMVSPNRSIYFSIKEYADIHFVWIKKANSQCLL